VSLFQYSVRSLDGGLRLSVLASAILAWTGLPKLPKRLKAFEICEGYRSRIFRKHSAAGIRDGENAAAHAVDQYSSFQIDLCPAKPVHESRLRVARQKFPTLSLGEAEAVGDCAA